MAVSAAEFRKLALALPDAVEASHMNHPDFRVGKKIFATLHHSESRDAVVKLTPEQQEMYLAVKPEMFAPEAGAWGRRGWTQIRFKTADKQTLQATLAAAHGNLADKTRTQK